VRRVIVEQSMAYLHEMRQRVVAHVTRFNPTNDFPIPFKLIDRELFDAAAFVREEKRIKLRGTTGYPQWAITPFTRLSATLDTDHPTDKCGPIYKVTLPFVPASLDAGNGIQTVMLTCGDVMVVERLTSMLRLTQLSRCSSISYTTPVYWIENGVMYFQGGGRDFSVCPINIYAVINSPNYDTTTCDDTLIQVPIQDDLVELAVMRVINNTMRSLGLSQGDLVNDGNMLADTTTTGRRS